MVTAKVKAALLNTPNVDSTEITVETFKGVVKLSGFLDSHAMIDAAVQAAQGVAGVKSVADDLTVKGQQGEQSAPPQATELSAPAADFMLEVTV